LGEIVATARLISQDDRVAEVTAELTDSVGQIVTTARAELRIRPRKSRPGI
jgi:acyl-coenzyme A thioesterase PaaI-like protein